MPKNGQRAHPSVRRLAQELKEVRHAVVDAKRGEYKDLLRIKRKEKSGDELYRSVFAILTQDIEQK
eukprot:6010467-Prymnesium_polylepis.1